MAEGNFQAGTQEDIKRLLLKTDLHGCQYEPEYSEEEKKHIEKVEEEEDKEAAAAAQHVSKDEDWSQPELEWSGGIDACIVQL